MRVVRGIRLAFQAERCRFDACCPLQLIMYTLKELVNKTIVHFVEYRKGNLWYNISGYEDFVFPVPIEDIGDAIFKASDSGMLFMRYIRKHLDNLQEAEKAKK